MERSTPTPSGGGGCRKKSFKVKDRANIPIMLWVYAHLILSVPTGNRGKLFWKA